MHEENTKPTDLPPAAAEPTTEEGADSKASASRDVAASASGPAEVSGTSGAEALASNAEHEGGQEPVSPEYADALHRHRSRHKGLLPAEWSVRIPTFEGPLDLLLHLIRVNQVEITDIPVALICDQYHAYLDLMEELDLDIAGEYIYEAAILIQLKSRLLLPQPKVEEGEPEPEDPRQELVQRLLEYQRIRDAAESLAEVNSLRTGLWTRKPQDVDLGDGPQELDLGDLSLFDLLKVFRQVMERFDREHPPDLTMRGETFSVRAQIDRFLRILDPRRPLDLIDDLLALSCRAEAIAAFLAVLEMGKLELIEFIDLAGGGVGLVRSEREITNVELEAITT